MFQKASFSRLLKVRILWLKVKHQQTDNTFHQSCLKRRVDLEFLLDSDQAPPYTWQLSRMLGCLLEHPISNHSLSSTTVVDDTIPSAQEIPTKKIIIMVSEIILCSETDENFVLYDFFFF